MRPSHVENQEGIIGATFAKRYDVKMTKNFNQEGGIMVTFTENLRRRDSVGDLQHNK